jgi:DNA polymerase elongation subunit (family B)
VIHESSRTPADLFGPRDVPGLVAVERENDQQVRIYQRDQDEVRSWVVDFEPWLITSPNAALATRSVIHQEPLAGDSQLSVLLRFRSWSRFRDARRVLRDDQRPFLAFGTPAEQYLIYHGQALLIGMEFDQLVRAQVDIETLGFDPRHDQIVLITCAINGRDETVFRADQLSEFEMIGELNEWIRKHDPDVIEGHNIFNFDIPFLASRARETGTSLDWGRDGSPVRQGGSRPFKAGPRTIPFEPAYIHGRHIVDTYQQIQRYDTGGELLSYGLKPAIEALGLSQAEREIIEGDQIAAAWRDDPERLVRYAVDDVRDTSTLSVLALPTEFYQAQLVPRSLQDVAIGGPGEKINDLLTSAYIRHRQSIPTPSEARPFPGGYAAVRRTGAFGPVVKADVESLYPAIMLSDEIRPASDHLGIFLPMLSLLTERRLVAKRQARLADGYDQARLQGIQSSLKVLINSFYGYLGYARGYFNDYDAAEQITRRGHDIILRVEQELEQRGATVIEIDTDGVYFQPPSSCRGLSAEETLIDEVSNQLGAGIRLAHDGHWQRMLSLRLKTYALLSEDGRLILKGSALRSRRDETFVRQFFEEAILLLLQERPAHTVRELYLRHAERIQQGRLAPEEFARHETVSDATFRSDSGRRFAAVAQGERVGTRVTVYERANGNLGRIEEYDQDEDRTYLLRRLRDAAERFRVLYDTDNDFNYHFPVVTMHTDLGALRSSQQTTQAKLFD